MESIITIPDNLDSDFKSIVRQYSYYDSDDDFDRVFDDSLNGLIQKGYREIDCRLYLAGMSLDYEETERLLFQGGNPDKRILGYCSSLDANNMDSFDIQCLSSDVVTRYTDAIDCYDLSKYWESGVKGQDMIVDTSQITNVLEGAAYILMARLIRKYKHA